jgi:hypothetical protein
VAAALAVALLGILPGAASAVEPVVMLDQNRGLTMPAGLAVDALGAVWTADEGTGICRVIPEGGPGLPGSLDTGGATCFDPFPLEPPAGMPAVAIGPVFVPGAAPGTGAMYVADGASNSDAALYRIPWQNGALDPGDSRVVLTLPGDRAVALTADLTGPVPALYLATKERPQIQRITLADCENGLCSGVDVGTPVGEVAALAILDGDIYIAEPLLGVTRIDDPQPIVGGAAEVVLPGDPSAVAADPASGRVYAAMVDPLATDDVVAFVPATGETSDYVPPVPGVGLQGVTAMTVRGGELYLGDDTQAAAGPDVTGGFGRVVRMPFAPLDLPRATVTVSPPALGNRRTVTFAAATDPAADLECRIDPPADLGAAWAPCGGPGTGQVEYRDLADGPHVFEVRARSASGTGPRTQVTFAIDSRAPLARVDDGPASLVAGGDAVFRLSADEPGAELQCRLNGGLWSPCGAELVLRGLGEARHELEVRATDLAGNVGPAAAAVFTVGTPAPPPVPTQVVAAVSDAGPRPPRVVRERGDLPLRPRGVLRGQRMQVFLNVPRSARVVRFSVTMVRGGRPVHRAAFRSLQDGPGRFTFRVRPWVARAIAARSMRIGVRLGRGLVPTGRTVSVPVRVAVPPPGARR